MLSLNSYRTLEKRLTSMHDVLSNSPGSIYIKDLQNRYLFCNNNQLKITGFRKLEDILGKNDYQMPWEESASLLDFNNKQVIARKKATTFYEHGLAHGSKGLTMLTVKQPFIHEDKIIGVYGSSIAIPPHKVINKATFHQNIIFIDIRENAKLQLTKRQKQTLFYILKGKGNKEIAMVLGLSKRTVEHHIEYLKSANNYDSLKEILMYVRSI